jgi:hypothetical protein
MDWDDYLREQAAMYRQLAEKTDDAFIKQELLELATVCEEVANNIEDRLASGYQSDNVAQRHHLRLDYSSTHMMEFVFKPRAT